MKTSTKLLALALALGACLQTASAGVTAVDLGTGLPPATLGGFTMVPYDPGSIAGGTPVTVGSGWATWGQGYTGTVYYTLTSNPLTLFLSGVQAVYFYEEPNQFADFYMTATDSSGAQVTTLINGYAGSAGVGFYVTNPGEYLSSITVTATDTSGFAIGEFGIDDGGGRVTGVIGAVPETGATLGFLAFGLSGLAACARFLRRKQA